MRISFQLIMVSLLLSGLLLSRPVLAVGLVTVDNQQWSTTAVRKVLHTFSYGGVATDQQIEDWAAIDPSLAIQQMLTFGATNLQLSPDNNNSMSLYAGSLAELQSLWSSTNPDNRFCPIRRANFDETSLRADGNVVLRNLGLQNTWIAAVRTRGLNTFRHRVAFWLVNYQMAVNLHDTEAPLVREHYDTALDALEGGAPFHEVLGLGATSAAVAREYGHRSNTYRNNTRVFRGNDDFAREFHQLFFRINGDIEDPVYHENTTIEHTAWALTGMQLDKEPNAYGTTLTRDWWLPQIDFSDHRDLLNRNIRNSTLHYAGDLEILHQTIGGTTAEQKLFNLAAVAINHPESLANMPVSIINFFADDNLTDAKMTAIRESWSSLVGTPNDLLKFFQAYAISTSFHQADTYKYRTAFDRNLTLYNLNTVDNEEAFGNTFSPRSMMKTQGAEVFIPVHDVFGGQTSLNAANNPNLFKEAHNAAVNFPNRIAKISEVCRDETNVRIGIWYKDWARVIPATNGSYLAADLGQWLWNRFIGDGGRNYGLLERSQVTALLATGMDFGFVVNPDNPAVSYSTDQLANVPLSTTVAANGATLVDLDSTIRSVRREANRRVGMAINFITMTPFMFASNNSVTALMVSVPDVTGQAQRDAVSTLKAAGLSIGTVTIEASNTVPAEGVISQNPFAGTEIPAGNTVDLVLSSGPPPDVTVPVITLLGSSTINLEQGESYVDAGATATDNVDGDISFNISAISTVNTNVVGTYSVTYDVIDAAGNAATQVSRTVIVKAKTTSDNLVCKEAVYKVKKDRLLVEIKTSDKSARRKMRITMDMDGNGIFERDYGIIPVERGSRKTYRKVFKSFANPNPTKGSMIRVTSDLGGMCSKKVKID